MLCGHERTLHCDDDVHLEADELGRYLGIALLAALCPAILYPEISSVAPAEFPKPSHKRTGPGAPGSGRARPEEADNWRLKWLLCPRRDRPRRRAAEQRDELAAAAHSITSSARASSVAGTSRPKIRAVCRLITNSNLVARRIGMSAGCTPLRTRPL